jgi:rubrerythrin
MLTLAEALERAIEAERQGAAFYRMLAGLFTDREAGVFLAEMAAEEDDHARALAALVDGGATTGGTDWERALSLGDHGTDPDAASGEGALDLLEAVDLALEAERHAAWTYASMGAECDGEVQELFTRLALTERHHAEILEELRARLVTPDDAAR